MYLKVMTPYLSGPFSFKEFQVSLARIRNRIPSSSYKAKRNPNDQVVLNTATTITKRNFQGTAHGIIQKGAFTRRHTLESKIISSVKARKPEHVVWSGAGLSTPINTQN